MHRAIGEQGEDGGANVTAARPWAPSTATGAGTEAATASELLAVASSRMAWMSVV
ncbi:MAG TPA: hypothetical protein VH299_06495 [Solirubrobacterales bacterium]|nr:hypothetical protein [Solirubrobacterales bacterium]